MTSGLGRLLMQTIGIVWSECTECCDRVARREVLESELRILLIFDFMFRVRGYNDMWIVSEDLVESQEDFLTES